MHHKELSSEPVKSLETSTPVKKMPDEKVKRIVLHHALLDVRLRILQILVHLPCKTTNARVIKSVLIDFGHHLSHDKLETELEWLDEQGLIEVTHHEITGARLTQRGTEVAAGIVKNHGVSTDI